MNIKKTIARLATSGIGQMVLKPITQLATQPCGIIFMLHRFHEDPAQRRWGEHDPAFVRKAFEEMRKMRLDIVPIDDIVRQHVRNEPFTTTRIAITIDDGYIDQAEIGAQIAMDYDIPATIFAVTSFLDDQWWTLDAKAQYLIDNSRSRFLSHPLLQHRALDLDSDADRWAGFELLVNMVRGNTLVDAERNLVEFAAHCGVELPDKAPAGYRPMSWDLARQIEKRGVTTGPHTVKHPLLSSEPDTIARQEIIDSVRRMREELRTPCEVFCYPTGRIGDFTQREYRYVSESNCIGAVSAAPGYLESRHQQDPSSRYAVPRFGMPNTLENLRQILIYLEYLKDLASTGLRRA